MKEPSYVINDVNATVLKSDGNISNQGEGLNDDAADSVSEEVKRAWELRKCLDLSSSNEIGVIWAWLRIGEVRKIRISKILWVITAYEFYSKVIGTKEIIFFIYLVSSVAIGTGVQFEYYFIGYSIDGKVNNGMVYGWETLGDHGWR